MTSADKILFEQIFDNQPLFRNQLDLVTQLLMDENTPYFVDQQNVDQYSKAQNRLKTYISQILSTTVARSITEDFKKGLNALLSKKLKGTGHNSEGVVNLIIEDLKDKNSRITKAEVRNSVTEQFYSDLITASYIAVITSRPLEIEMESSSEEFSLRHFLFTDLLERLNDPGKDLKYYRFNFPMDTYGHLFWRGLKRILHNFITKNWSAKLLESLHSKFTIKTDTWLSLAKNDKLNTSEIEYVVNEVLLLLNTNRYILVFHATIPIYGMPLVILNPSEQFNIKVYALFDTDTKKINIMKYSDKDTVLWRVFVWDKLKSKGYAGKEITYKDSI